MLKQKENNVLSDILSHEQFCHFPVHLLDHLTKELLEIKIEELKLADVVAKRKKLVNY